MNACLVLPETFALRYSTICGNTVVFGLTGSTPFGICPLCSKVSHNGHGYYERKVQDLPISGKTVKLYISTKKIICEQKCCSGEVFAERFDSWLKPWQRICALVSLSCEVMPQQSSSRAARHEPFIYP